MMKLYLLLVPCSILFAHNAIAQKQYTELGSSPEIPSPIETYKTDLEEAKGGTGATFNTKMLDVFFADKIGTAFGNSNDLSLQKYFATLNSSEGSFTLGYNFDDRGGDVLKQLDFIFSGGFKFKAEENFSTLVDSEGFQGSNLGAFLKISYIGNGRISFAKKYKKDKEVVDRKSVIEAYRKIAYDTANEKVEAYNKNEFTKEKAVRKQLQGTKHELPSLGTLLEGKKKNIYKSIADDEIQYLKANKLYRWIFDYWVSLDGYVPFGSSTYDVVPIMNSEPTKEDLYGFDVNLSANAFIEWSVGQSIFLKTKLSVYGTNNIELDELKKTSFQTGNVNDDGTVTVAPLITAYDTVYDDFVQQSFTIEPAYFILNNTVGFSPAIEYNISKRYKATNWKLGIPVSLKDKDGKPKVNFEIQWKQVSTLSKTNHLVGVTTSFLFGDLIN